MMSDNLNSGSNSHTNIEGILGHDLPEDIYLLKKKLKYQQSLLSDKIKLENNTILKSHARTLYNEVSKLRRKARDRDSILQLMQISVLALKILSNHEALKEIAYFNELSHQIKLKASRAWKILAGAMIGFSLIFSNEVLMPDADPSR